MLPRGLSLFFADAIDVDSGRQIFQYIVAQNEFVASRKWIKEMNKVFYRYDYYFYEVDDETEIQKFIEKYGTKAGIYNKY